MPDDANVAVGGASEADAAIPKRPVVATASIADDPPTICDADFIREVQRLKKLRLFLMERGKTTQGGADQLGSLNVLRFQEDGRFPYQGEWQQIEDIGNRLYQSMTEADRRRFLYGQIPQGVVTLAQVSSFFALVSLIGAIAVATFLPGVDFQAWKNVVTFVCFLLWVGALGAIGSIAFIGMNVLAVQDDATFDLLNTKLISLRVMLGAVFAVVLSLPFSYGPFANFAGLIFVERDTPTPIADVPIQSAVFLLLPFVLGFSTSLVIMILNQFVEAVQSFFGRRGGAPNANAAQAPAAQPPAAQPPAAQAPAAQTPATPSAGQPANMSPGAAPLAAEVARGARPSLNSAP